MPCPADCELAAGPYRSNINDTETDAQNAAADRDGPQHAPNDEIVIECEWKPGHDSQRWHTQQTTKQ
jgi:hypothetical protein